MHEHVRTMNRIFHVILYKNYIYITQTVRDRGKYLLSEL